MNQALAIFAALAEPTRLRIFGLLRAMELAIGELALVLGQSQPRVSRHVKIMADAGILRRRREGAWVFLGLGDAAVVAPLLATLDAWNGGEAVADIARLAAVRAERARAAEEYFNAHAAEWDAMRSLHVAESEVEAAIRAALAGASVGWLVDIGTGTGRMIALLGGAAVRVTGVDRSPEMLRLAREKVFSAGLKNVELHQGDMAALPLPAGCADTAVIHQVLHYAPAPEAVIAEASRLLAPGGRLLVVDFAPHEHEEFRTRHAHARLGFSDAQMAAWFAAAGLEGAPPTALAGGALTVKLWLGHASERKT